MHLLTLKRATLLLATCIAGVGGFLLATNVLGGDPPQAQLPIPVDSPPSEYTRLTPGDAEFAVFPVQFKDFPIYWVGEEFAGHPLRFIIRQVFSPTGDNLAENEVSFIYGSCGAEHHIDGGCAPPLQIQVSPYCLIPPELVGNGTFPTDLVKVRGGADAVTAGGGLRLWTGAVTIKVYASSDELLEDATAALVSPNGLGVSTAGALLPAPDRDCSGYRTVPLHRESR